MAHAARVLAVAAAAALAFGLARAGNGATPPSLPALLARHAPFVVLHPAERFRPVPVDGYLADSDLQRKTPAGWETIAGPLPVGGADLRLDQRSCNPVDGPLASPCYAESEAAHAAASAMYTSAFRTRTRIVLEYWFFYPYDDYSPTVPAGDVWQVHEGDWEAISIVLDRAGTPLFAGYSEHSSGKRRDWAKVPKRGSHPFVYVALGSHANYFRRGTVPLDPRTIDPTLIALIAAQGVKPVEHAGGGALIRPLAIPVTAKTPTWMGFAGNWGETAYVHVPNNDPIPVGLGPRGPAFHRQWRLPVKEPSSWPLG